MDFLELAKSRYSCRKFSNKPVEQEKIDKIIEAAIAAPTAANLQPFKIWQLNKDSINKMSKATPFTFSVSAMLVVGANKSRAYNRNFDGKNFAEIDATIVATHIMMEIQDLGLATTWIGHFDPVILNKEFPEMEKYEVVAIFPIGYAADDAKISELHYNTRSKEELFTKL